MILRKKKEQIEWMREEVDSDQVMFDFDIEEPKEVLIAWMEHYEAFPSLEQELILDHLLLESYRFTVSEARLYLQFLRKYARNGMEVFEVLNNQKGGCSEEEFQTLLEQVSLTDSYPFMLSLEQEGWTKREAHLKFALELHDTVPESEQKVYAYLQTLYSPTDLPSVKEAHLLLSAVSSWEDSAYEKSILRELLHKMELVVDKRAPYEELLYHAVQVGVLSFVEVVANIQTPSLWLRFLKEGVVSNSLWGVEEWEVFNQNSLIECFPFEGPIIDLTRERVREEQERLLKQINALHYQLMVDPNVQQAEQLETCAKQEKLLIMMLKKKG